MNNLIIYSYDNKKIKLIVRSIAKSLNADTCEINEVNGLFISKIRSFFRLKSNILPLNVSLADYDNIILVTKVYKNNIIPSTLTFLNEYLITNKNFYLLIAFNNNVDKIQKNILEVIKKSG